MRLREELAAMKSLFGQPKKMVLIGHSMGGLVSRMQVISPGREIWNARLGDQADELYAKLPADHLAKRMAVFSSNPDIGREIYISTPHRGSGLADLSITSLFVKILTLPSTLPSASIINRIPPHSTTAAFPPHELRDRSRHRWTFILVPGDFK